MKTRKLTAKQRELQASWNSLVDKWASAPKFARTPSPRVASKATTRPASSPIAEGPSYPSLVTPGGSTAPAKTHRYTGTAILGIATMHKSNPVPVFSKEDAISVARMRRG